MSFPQAMSQYEEVISARARAIHSISRLMSLVSEMGEIVRPRVSYPLPDEMIRITHDVECTLTAIDDLIFFFLEVDQAAKDPYAATWIQGYIDRYNEIIMIADEDYDELLELRKQARRIYPNPPVIPASAALEADVTVEHEYVRAEQALHRISYGMPIDNEVIEVLQEYLEAMAESAWYARWNMEEGDIDGAINYYYEAYWGLRFIRNLIDSVSGYTHWSPVHMTEFETLTSWLEEYWHQITEDIVQNENIIEVFH